MTGYRAVTWRSSNGSCASGAAEDAFEFVLPTARAGEVEGAGWSENPITFPFGPTIGKTPWANADTAKKPAQAAKLSGRHAERTMVMTGFQRQST